MKSHSSCVAGSPHFDPEGMVCANDGEPNEAYCSCMPLPALTPSQLRSLIVLELVADDVGESTCARCKNHIIIKGKECAEGDVVVVEESECVPGHPHFDPEGMVCHYDGQPTESYCSYDVGPKLHLSGYVTILSSHDTPQPHLMSYHTSDQCVKSVQVSEM